MQEFGDLHHVLVLGPHLAANAREAAQFGFLIGDADDVIVSHRIGNVLGRFAGQVKGCAVSGQHSLYPVKIGAGIGEVLKLHDFFQPGAGHYRSLAGKLIRTGDERLPFGQKAGRALGGIWLGRRGDRFRSLGLPLLRRLVAHVKGAQ